MYKFLSSFLLLILFANEIKILYSNSVRRYGGDLISRRLHLPVKFTESSGVFQSISSEIDGHSGISKKCS